MPDTITDKSINANDLIGKYNKLNSNFVNYQNAYNLYVDCYNKGEDKDVCKTSSGLTNKAGILKQDIIDVSNAITPLKSNSNLNTILSTPELKAKYADLQALRNKLDVQLAELYNVEGSIPNMYKNQMDSTIYASVLWTVLATSMVYYIFTKM
jgi:hypothetical protein